MFKPIAWGVSFPLLLVAVMAGVWVALDAAVEDDYVGVAWLLLVGAAAGSFVSLLVGYMLRPAALRD
jgi:hypothetical protein